MPIGSLRFIPRPIPISAIYHRYQKLYRYQILLPYHLCQIIPIPIPISGIFKHTNTDIYTDIRISFHTNTDIGIFVIPIPMPIPSKSILIQIPDTDVFWYRYLVLVEQYEFSLSGVVLSWAKCGVPLKGWSPP